MYAAHEAFPDERCEGYVIIWDMVNSTWLDFLEGYFSRLNNNIYSCVGSSKY